MRYWKGSITLSPEQDIPLLQQVLRSGFITHNQLYEFMRMDYRVVTRSAFCNRTRRLVDHDMLSRLDKSSLGRGPVYTIAEFGTALLVGTGEFYAGPTIRPGGEPDWNAMRHAVELNDIQLTLKRAGLLGRWTSETEIRSRNELTASGYLKDYDAIVSVPLGDKHVEFALEYERTPKGTRHYERIRATMEREPRVSHFLYLVANHDLLSFVFRFFRHAKRPISFGLSNDFLKSSLSMRVLTSGRATTISLSDFLNGPSPSAAGRHA